MYSEGEIWWCGVGKNVGVEIAGKNIAFSRPVLVYKKLNRISFLAIPLSTKKKQGSWYIPFRFRGKNETAVLSQIKIMSVYRLYDKIGEVDETDFAKIKKGFINLYVK